MSKFLGDCIVWGSFLGGLRGTKEFMKIIEEKSFIYED